LKLLPRPAPQKFNTFNTFNTFTNSLLLFPRHGSVPWCGLHGAHRRERVSITCLR
jgi:hypothetical protein